MSDPVNIESVRVTAEWLRKVEEPFKSKGDPKGLAIGAMAYVVEGAAAEIEQLRAQVVGSHPHPPMADELRKCAGDATLAPDFVRSACGAGAAEIVRLSNER